MKNAREDRKKDDAPVPVMNAVECQAEAESTMTDTTNSEEKDTWTDTAEKNNICKNCKHFHMLKEFTQCGWIYKNVCTMLVDCGGLEYDDFCIVVQANDRCEVFGQR